MLDIEEEQRYGRLKRLAQELHIPTPEAFLTLEVLDKDGKLIQKHKQRSHSWVRNAYNVIFCQLAGKDADDDTFGSGKLCQKTPSGTLKHGNFPASVNVGHDNGVITTSDDVPASVYSGGGYRAGAGEDSWGIIVGSGENAESFEDYALQTQVANGVGAGQLSHVESEPHSVTWTAGTLTFKNELVRYFNNNSGGDVSVNEVAIVCKAGTNSAASEPFLMSRDKLASTVTIPDTGQLKVTYTIQLTYPA